MRPRGEASLEPLLRAVDLSPSMLAERDGRIRLDRYQALIAEARRVCADPGLVLDWAAAVDMAELSIVGLIMNASRTMGEAFAQLQRFERLALEVDVSGERRTPRFTLEMEDEALWLVDNRPDPNAFPELTEIAFARLVCGPRRFLDQPHVLEVRFTHDARSDKHAYERVFQCPVGFSRPRNAMRLAPDIADWPVALQPSYVLPILSRHAESLMAASHTRDDVRTQVERRLIQVLPTGAFSARSIAADLAMSRQSLYRRLRGEGASFSEILDRLRERLAREHLTAPGASINEIAYLIGFADPASFSRAFKRWTGQSPKSFRAAAQR